MATYIPAINVAEVALFGLLASQQIVSVYNFLYPAAIAPTDLDDLAEAAVTAWQPNYGTYLSNQMHITSAKATDLTTQFAGVSQYYPSTDIAGGVNSPSIANNAALVISHHTALRGRSYRGRTYIAGVPNSGLANSTSVLSSFQIDLLASFSEYINVLEALGGDFVIVSRQLNGSARVTAAATPVTGNSINLDLDSQRNRLSGRGA